MGAFGIRYAEIGFAGANQFVTDLTGASSRSIRAPCSLPCLAGPAAVARKSRIGPTSNSSLLDKKRVPVAVVVVKSRLLDIAKSLETTPEENLLMVLDTIQCLQDNGLEVFVDFEHAMDAACGRRENGNPCGDDEKKRSLDYFHQIVAQCVDQKVSRLVVCDTNGGASPEEVTQVIGDLTRSYPKAKFGFHGHTDRGLGVANSRAAILAGAIQVQGTLLGTGERCGNVNLTTVVGGMQLRGEAEFVAPESLTGLTRPRAFGLRGLRARSAARHAHRRARRFRHLGWHAWQQ